MLLVKLVIKYLSGSLLTFSLNTPNKQEFESLLHIHDLRDQETISQVEADRGRTTYLTEKEY